MKKASMFCLLCSLSVASSSIQLLMHSFNGMKTSSVFQHKLKTHWNSLFCGLNNYQILLFPLENTQKQSVKHSNKSYIYIIYIHFIPDFINMIQMSFKLDRVLLVQSCVIWDSMSSKIFLYFMYFLHLYSKHPHIYIVVYRLHNLFTLCNV